MESAASPCVWWYPNDEQTAIILLLVENDQPPLGVDVHSFKHSGGTEVCGLSGHAMHCSLSH